MQKLLDNMWVLLLFSTLILDVVYVDYGVKDLGEHLFFTFITIFF
jgi:hypothetical protein